MWICSIASALQNGCVIGSLNCSRHFWLFVFTQLETWRTAVLVNNNSWCALCVCKCLLVLNAFCYFLTCTPLLSLPFNLNFSLFIVLLGPSPSSHTAMTRTVSCRQHADSSNPPLIRLYNTSLNPPRKPCTPWSLPEWDFKDAAEWGMNFLCRTVCSTATWSQTGNVKKKKKKVFSIC